jgi:iron complex outermembrane recepter protein
MYKNLIRNVACISCAIATYSGPVFAQSKGWVLEEIIVTATKREESLQDISVAVAVVDGDLLDNQSIGTLDELTMRMPSVMMSEAMAATNIFIRGVGSGQNFGFEQSVGMFIDGAYFSRGRSFRNPFFDVERVEVLKGPQTVLFGKNVVSGAFNITTRKPTDEWESSLTGYVEPEYSGKRLSGTFSGPLTESLGVRISGQTFSSDGYMENSLPGAEDPYGRDEYLLRGALQWDPTDELRINLKVEQGQYDVTGGYATQATSLSPGHLALIQAVDPRAEDKLDYRVSVPATNDPLFEGTFNDTDTENVTLSMNWSFENSELTSVTSYIAFDFETKTNNDFTNLNIVAGPERHKSETFAQEIRLASITDQFLEYIVGAYYSDDKLRTRRQATLDLSLSALAGVFASDRLGRNQQFAQDAESWAVFGELTMNLSDDFRLKLGLRYTEDDKIVDKQLWYSDASTLDNATPDPVIAASYNGVIGVEHKYVGVKRKTDDIPFAITAEWDVSGDLLTYAYYKEGFKAGGFDEDFTSGVPDEFEFEDEGVKAYAVGAKWTLADGRAYINAELFNSEFTNLQVSTFSVASFLVGNAAAATSRGLDVDTRWQITEEFGVGGSFVWLDATYDDYTQGPCVLDAAGNPTAESCDLSGQPLQYAPDVVSNIYAEYSVAVFSDWTFDLNVDVNYSDEFFLAGDLDPDIMQDSYVKLNSTLSLTSPSEMYRFSIIGKNLTDEMTSHQGNDIPLANFYGGKAISAFVDPPRTVALQAEVRF